MKRMILVSLFLLPSLLVGGENPDIFGMSLEELLAVRINSAASLTKTEPSKAPASVTLITREMIRNSGARNLDELLEIYVPNFERLRQAGGPRFGIRGIISDVDNKTLLLVNGRVMNNHSLNGAISERYLSMLGDISSIEVIRGPGSAMYGPGAINGVISIKTLTAKTFEGTDISFTQGVGEEYSLVETRYGKQFSDHSGLFLYFGLDDYAGADPDDSPLVYSKDGTFFSAGQKITDPELTRDNEAALGKPRHKAHLHFYWDNFDFWARNTRGGLQFVNARHLIEGQNSFATSDRLVMYDQLTLEASQRIPFSKQLSLKLTGGYDIFDVVTDQERKPSPDYDYGNAFREDELNFKALLDWDIAKEHSLALGFEFSHEEFGGDADLLTDDPGHLQGITSKWDARTYSVFGEYQWNPNRFWTFFAGGRADKYAYAGWMYSPRLSCVFTPNDKHQFKAMLNRGVRKGDELYLKIQSEGNQEPDTEQIDMAELRHDWKLTTNLTHSLSLFYFDHDVLGFVQQQLAVLDVGDVAGYGAEFELNWHSTHHTIGFSHSYTKMADFTYNGSGTQVVTSEPYGYGDDLANWANHLSKLRWQWRLAEKWRMNSFLTVYWGYPGAEDYTEFNNAAEIPGHRNAAYGQSDGRTDAFDPSAFLSSGLQYQARENVRLSIHCYNILGWVDEDLNKRNYYARMAGYRIEAPAASIGLEIRF